MTLDADTCYRALTSRDARFDGLFYVGVSTTGVYCRPVCSARTPGRQRCAFFPTAAQAERAGFRACFRCRPELAPGSAPVDAVPRLVTAALARIDGGFLNERSIEDLAAELGVTGRHLRRAMEAELGVSPVELAQSRKLALAKRLLQDTRLRLADVAFASGFQSVRRFNALFQARFGRSPTSLRRDHGGAPGPREILLRLDYRPPLEWDALLAFLGDRAIPGVESVADGEYRRTVCVGEKTGVVVVRHDAKRSALAATVSASLAGALMHVVARLRTLFDLDAQPAAIAATLGRTARLRPLVRRRPGLRVPGAFDPFEATVRAVLGQQVSVRAATTLAGRLAERFGAPLPLEERFGAPLPLEERFGAPLEAEGESSALSRVFPSPHTLAAADERDIASLGLTGARARSLAAFARAVACGSLKLDPAAPIDETLRALEALPGFGPWTAQYVAMRALHWPDAFPASDLGVRKALGGLGEKDALAAAEAWRPWRAYAVMHLWTSLSEGASP